jgi:DNA-binding transcriptional MerR regulator
VQPYVLRSWEAEFPDLGVAKSASSPRVYRRADIERVLRIKHLLFVDGLTLAGARRRLSEEGVPVSDEAVNEADVAAMLDKQTRHILQDVRRGLNWVLGVLSGDGSQAEDFALRAEPLRAVHQSSRKAKARPVKRAGKKKKR